MWRWMVVGSFIGVAACDPANPCDQYVDYMCDCHPEVSCDDLSTTYAAPDPSVQDECAVLLEQQEEDDAANGVECPVTTTPATE